MATARLTPHPHIAVWAAAAATQSTCRRGTQLTSWATTHVTTPRRWAGTRFAAGCAWATVWGHERQCVPRSLPAGWPGLCLLLLSRRPGAAGMLWSRCGLPDGHAVQDLVVPPMESPNKYSRSPLLGNPTRNRTVFAFFKGTLHGNATAGGLPCFLCCFLDNFTYDQLPFQSRVSVARAASSPACVRRPIRRSHAAGKPWVQPGHPPASGEPHP